MKGIVSNVECILLENHFDEDWPEIRKILIEDYGFTCYNMETDEKLDMESLDHINAYARGKYETFMRSLDYNFLPKGLTLYESLLKSKDFVLHYLCFDEKAYKKLLPYACETSRYITM